MLAFGVLLTAIDYCRTASTGEFPAYAREQLQTAVRQTLGRPKFAAKESPPSLPDRSLAWGWRWVLGLAIATAVVLLSVPQSVAAILSERKERTKLGLSKYAAEAAEEAAEHRDKLGIAGKVRDVSAIHSSLWPEEPKTNEILPGWRNLIGAENGRSAGFTQLNAV